MNVEKKVIHKLSKCYSLSLLTWEGQECFLVAAEKHDPCLLFSREGRLLDTVWEGPGGVMTMEPWPGRENTFLATQEFYSPNDCKNARIVWAQYREGAWQVSTLCEVPYVHRFGVLRRGGRNYLLVCCLKSGYEGRDDWSQPGLCLAAELPEEPRPLVLEPIRTGLLKNHGYSKLTWQGHDAALVACQQGTLLFCPPETPGGSWQITTLCPDPSSDSVLLDLDGDGQPELGTISPFHGDTITIYHLDSQGIYQPQWRYGAPQADTEMVHGTWAAPIFGKPTWLVGWRKGTRETAAITWDPEARTYAARILDRDVGCANLMTLPAEEDRQVIVAANRETDEIAYYTLTP